MSAQLAGLHKAYADLTSAAKGYQGKLPADLTEDDRDLLDMAWWMSWQPIGQLAPRLRERLDHLAALNLVELHQPDGARAVSRFRLRVERDQPGFRERAAELHGAVNAEIFAGHVKMAAAHHGATAPRPLSDIARDAELAAAGGNNRGVIEACLELAVAACLATVSTRQKEAS